MKKFFTSIRSKLMYLAITPMAQMGDFIPSELQANDLQGYIRILLSAAFGLAGLVATIYLIWGGYSYIVSGGGEGAENAKKTITNAIIGLVIIVIAFALMNFVWQQLTQSEYENQQLESF